MKRFLGKLYKKGVLSFVEPSSYISDSYLKKSESNLMSAKILLESNHPEESVVLIYYSSYNLILSLLFLCGIKCENHSASIFLLKFLFEVDNSFILEAKKERIDKQYYVGFDIKKLEVSGDVKNAEIFNSDLKGVLFNLNSGKVKKIKSKLEDFLNG